MNGRQFIISTESDCSDGLLRDHSFCKLTRWNKQTNKHRQKKQDKQNKNKTKTNEQIKQK